MQSVKAIPGSIRYNGPHDGRDAVCRVLVYDADAAEEHADVWPPPPQVEGRVDWYDFRGLGDHARAQELAESLHMPPLAIEDAMDISQRPKYEELEQGFLFTINQLRIGGYGEVESQKVTLFWTTEFVLTLQEYPDDIFAHVTDRILRGNGRIRKRGAAYLAYALIDNLLDDYTDSLLELEERIDRLEAKILEDVSDDTEIKSRIYRLKVIANRYRSTLGPVRDAVTRWVKSEHPSREPRLKPYLRDLLDNALRANQLADDYITRTNDLYQLFTSELSIRTNKVVQLLTVVSTIFIPLTFLTGLYGMNFEYIPELGMRHGYFILWGIMLVVTVGLLGFFGRKGWL